MKTKMTEAKICKIEGCNGNHKIKGYCQKHYKRFLEYINKKGGIVLQ